MKIKEALYKTPEMTEEKLLELMDKERDFLILKLGLEISIQI